MKKITLVSPVNQIPFVGPTYLTRLHKLNIFSIKDLLHHYPSRHDDLSIITKIISVKPNQVFTIKAEVVSCQNIFTKNNKKIQEAIIKDQSGSIKAIWFNQIYIPNTLKGGTNVSFSGKVGWFNRKLTLISPQYEVIGFNNNKNLHTGRLVPIYPETSKLSSKWLRSRINWCLENLKTELKKDWLPENIKKNQHLINLGPAINNIHFPDNNQSLELAIKRLEFDEMLLLQLNALQKKKQWQQKNLSHQLIINQKKILKLISDLPFKLTKAQNTCIKEILTDLKKHKPMNRLLQGDVGSGKTIVAAITIYVSYLNGFNSIIMAPTTILANQHYNSLKEIFAKTQIKISLITSSSKQNIDKADILVGTHALLFKKINSQKIGVLVIDEQHRFGVKQRSAFLGVTKKSTPHTLTMTATPIPRTIALTAYADLDMSLLDEMPKGRKPIKTWIVPVKKRLDAYNWIAKEIKKHHTQAFIVYPLIDPSESETLKDIKAATNEFNQLKSIFSHLNLSLLHGKIKDKQKQIIIKKFQKNKTNILVSTPVIEVGIDIPNATIILIESAERFGLAQLHQLRGRVGRSHHSSYCLIFSGSTKEDTLSRLKAMETLNSGLKLAELDLKLRGPGDLYGLKQHGFTNLKLASLTNTQLIKKTKNIAINIIDNYPSLLKKISLESKIETITLN
ncbi:MAG: ATP-dependent DNA helicase RecG [Candidatus Beckwithbacteria bacterium]|nr:ATP-dependent DNA helicase RecG [Patescibacteria group bacterium]